MLWNRIENRKPIANETGCLDGKKNNKVLVYNGKYHVAIMYHTIIDGSESFDFYDDRDFDIQNVTHWTEIDAPF